MQGKTVLITGATNGIGEQTALALAQMGAQVVGIGRNAEKCAAVAERIKRETGNPRVDFLVADLSLVAQTKRVARDFKQKYTRLDVLVNNAGGFFLNRTVTAEGFEMTWALNHLSYFVLTLELLELLKHSAPARIVNVSSGAHQVGALNLADWNSEKRFGSFPAYGNSKLANVMFTYELARRLAGTGVTANVLHPGSVATGFAVNNTGLVGVIYKFIQRFVSLTPAQGAETPEYLASAPEVATVTGKYFDKCKAVPSSKYSYDEEKQKALWALSEQQVSAIA